MSRAAAGLAVLVLVGCTAPAPEKSSGAETTRSATESLQDAVIKTAVEAQLLDHLPDSMANVRVTVRDRYVSLRGTVTDAKTRDELVALTERVVHVEGVRNELRIDPQQRRLGSRLSDVALATRVQTAIASEVGLQPVRVHVDRGVAALDGEVRDAKTKAAIVAAARGTTGIRNVVDRIRVGGP